MASMNFDPGLFRALDANPGGTLEAFNKYEERMKLVFELAFRKADGTPYTPSDKEKKAMLLFRGGDDMRDLFDHVGHIDTEDTYAETITKIRDALQSRTNSVVQRNMLLTSHPQGTKSFEKWSKEISDSAKLISYENYNWKQAAVDAILLQTSSQKLRERALQENVSYSELITLGIAKEQSQKGASLLEKASGHESRSEDPSVEVRKLRLENKRLKAQLPAHTNQSCPRCGNKNCTTRKNCPAIGQTCSNCKKPNHFAKVCRSKPTTRKSSRVRQLSSAEESDSESSGRIIVGRINTEGINATIKICGSKPNAIPVHLQLATDTGVSKTIINRSDWEKLQPGCRFTKTSKRFRPFGTQCQLPIKGKSKVSMTAQQGATINTKIYIVDDSKEQSLLGKEDAVKLGIVILNPAGASEAYHQDNTISTRNIKDFKELPLPENETIVSGGQTQAQIDHNMSTLINNYPNLFSDKTGKFTGKPIKIQFDENASPVIQPTRRIPLHYIDSLNTEIDKMLRDDIIEGPIEMEEKGTFISNLVITDKKWDKTGKEIRVTLDCQAANKVIYQTHEPIPTCEELRHQLKGSDRFTLLDITNCFHQFEIDEASRKLFTFRIPRGLFRYKRMVMGTSPASSEIQKRIRETLTNCPKALNIKDDILVHGIGQEHDNNLKIVLDKLQSIGVTLRKSKCSFGQPQVKWFGNIFSKNGMSPDPEKCNIIQNWPRPTSTAEVKSFLQTVQFNAKFLGGKAHEKSYPELTAPLRILTKKNAKFVWSSEHEQSFIQLKNRLTSDSVMVPFDTTLPTRLYVDSSPVGTQATLAQKHTCNSQSDWRPVNHTSRSWTETESHYSQIERESNGILTGMLMNRMYTIGTHIEIVTDHKPLVPIYSGQAKPKQLRIDRHRTKLLPFSYNIIYEPGKDTPCDYGSRHPEPITALPDDIKQQWGISNPDEIFVNRVIEDSLPQAITLDMLRQETEIDPILQQLKFDIINRNECRNSLHKFRHIFQECSFINGILMRGHQIILPENLQAEAIGLAHEGHMGADKTLNLLRQTCWFPNMSEQVRNYVQSCIPCAAAIPHTRPEPLQPHLLPDRPWQKVHADFKGPIGASYYLHIVIDQFSKYPEVDIVKSTKFSKLEPCLDRIFATHGIPEELTTDNGSPYFADEMETYAKKMGFKHHPVTPRSPQSNGFAENFVKLMCKLVHTSIASGKDPKKELQTYLLQYRSTPHTTTGKSPAELLFNRKLQTKLPIMFTPSETPETTHVRQYHDNKKLRQKALYDKKHRAMPKDVKIGDQILIKQTKTTTDPPFDPKPYNVIAINGNQVTATRNGQTRKRLKGHIKVIKDRSNHVVTKKSHNTPQYDSSIEGCKNKIFTTFTPHVAPGHHIEPVAQASIAQNQQHPSRIPRYQLRSKSEKLSWNPKLNSDTAVIVTPDSH